MSSARVPFILGVSRPLQVLAEQELELKMTRGLVRPVWTIGRDRDKIQIQSLYSNKGLFDPDTVQ